MPQEHTGSAEGLQRPASAAHRPHDSRQRRYHGQVEALAPALAFGLPVAAVLVMAMVATDRLLRAGERRGIVVHARRWSSAGIGNALLELHLSFEPAKASRVELVADFADPGDRVGDGRNDRPGPNVIPIDFVGRRRL